MSCPDILWRHLEDRSHDDVSINPRNMQSFICNLPVWKMSCEHGLRRRDRYSEQTNLKPRNTKQLFELFELVISQEWTIQSASSHRGWFAWNCGQPWFGRRHSNMNQFCIRLVTWSSNPDQAGQALCPQGPKRPKRPKSLVTALENLEMQRASLEPDIETWTIPDSQVRFHYRGPQLWFIVFNAKGGSRCFWRFRL
jgi:hypothetical protein